MRKFLQFAFVGAIALTGFGLASCSSDDDLDNPNGGGLSGEAVKTTFTISFPENVANTKQTAATVQNTEAVADFRGMDNIVLIPFNTQGDADTDPIASTTLPLGQAITLTNMIKPTTATVSNSIPAATLTTAKGNAVLYNDVDIPLGTGSFLFYGKAIDNGTEKFVNGALTATVDAAQTPANYGFAPVPIYTTGSSTIGTALAEYVSAIAAATGWAAVTEAQNAGLKNLYDNFTSLKAGSSRDVQGAVLDLYQSLYKNTDAVSKAIVTAILTKATAPATPDGSLTFDSSLGAVTNTITATSEDNTYPADLGIPDGVAILDWNTATPKVATQKIDGNLSNVKNFTGKFTDYVYPASLYYVANSGVVTATTSQQANYDGSKDWAGTDGILAGYTAGKSVQSSSKSVAIVDQIQYAVGRLDTKVTAAAATLYDRKGDAVAGTDGTRFPITGILIGGQKPVDYMFTNPSGTAEFTIYDNIHKANNGTFPYATTTGSAYNYTLALETAASTPIYVAVEFLNNSGQDFVGFDGVVPEGGKFYLVAQLDPTSTTEAANADATGKKVFKQDFKTIANFTIAAGKANTDPTWVDGTTENTGGLGAAYNTIPDLRTPKLELGLSVNLNWQAGITFTHTF
ncbi:MAG: hypothetical protein IKO67_00580 [Bacteroidaceae bacterium]|nr:hypothetical protein [Bacteroidaceae bacterium]